MNDKQNESRGNSFCACMKVTVSLFLTLSNERGERNLTGNRAPETYATSLSLTTFALERLLSEKQTCERVLSLSFRLINFNSLNCLHSQPFSLHNQNKECSREA